MATYQSRDRDPLLDQGTQAMLERRGRELLGLVLLAVALFFAAALASYSPQDPGWMVATDEPARNWMGRMGAAVASTLMVIGGLGAWGIPLVIGLWGGRFLLHRGAERAGSRAVFAVIAVAFGSVFAATHVPGADWPHPAIGLGGLFGDTVLGAILTVLPVGPGLGLRFLSLTFGAALVVMLLYVTGFTRGELRAIGAFLTLSTVVTYARLRALAGYGTAVAAQAAVQLHARHADRRAAAAAAAPARGEVHFGRPEALRPATLRAERPQALPRPAADHAPRPGLLARLPGMIARTPAAEPAQAAAAEDMTTDDRLRARIADVIRARTGAAPAAPSPIQAAIARREPPLNRRGPAPMIATPRSDEPPVSRVLPPTLPPLADSLTEDEVFEGADVFDARAEDLEMVDDLPPLPRAAPETRRLVQPTAKKPSPPSRQALAEAQPSLRFDGENPAYELPPLALLASPATVKRHTLPEEQLEENARMLESVLDDYGVKGEIVSVRPGPVVTMYELEPAPGLKASRVIGLADDIARSMSALSARVSTVPGRSVIGIELPNATREKVVLREILAARDFGDSALRLPLALGKDIAGDPIVANLAKMPHLLIAGTTGSGKSVAINTMILSLLYKLTPEECRLIMIDPKMLELSVYDGIPHLLSPVVTDPKKAVVALKWVVGEMEDRYRRMSKMGVRNIEGYNGRVREALAKGETFKRTIQTGFDEDTGDPVFETEEDTPVAIPYIVVIVDEMADLMMVAGKEIEACIQRLAQMARASGIHLIMATQRPSVDVITGTIKANFPTRISFQVTSKIDSRTILGEQGAEQLLGMGDMLYMAGGGRISRIHGPFVSDEEVEEVVSHLKSFGPPAYMSGVVEGPDEDSASDIDMVLGLGSGEASDDQLYDQAVAIVARDRKCSTSYIQRKLGIGYQKAARLVEKMEDQGVVTRANHVGKREILVEER
jgi:S-DNA-T family DNA segregation ATPase FtsK/SpoIIIE